MNLSKQFDPELSLYQGQELLDQMNDFLVEASERSCAIASLVSTLCKSVGEDLQAIEDGKGSQTVWDNIQVAKDHYAKAVSDFNSIETAGADEVSACLLAWLDTELPKGTPILDCEVQRYLRTQRDTGTLGIHLPKSPRCQIGLFKSDILVDGTTYPDQWVLVLNSDFTLQYAFDAEQFSGNIHYISSVIANLISTAGLVKPSLNIISQSSWNNTTVGVVWLIGSSLPVTPNAEWSING